MMSPEDSALRKPVVLARLIDTLRAEADAAEREARAAYEAATDADSRAENKYDTRSLEASYLARGQARRVAELTEAVAAFAALAPVADGRVGLGSLVCLGEGRGADWYFIGPAAGGTEVTVDGVSVMVVTPGSPLGGKLVGLREGDRVALAAGRPAVRVGAVR